MEKPVTKRISDNIPYYLKLCEAKGDSPDTIVNKAADWINSMRGVQPREYMTSTKLI
ncbi:hypothetical protein SAMN05216262_1357 [Colwellia chukchiensis]|uniref:Uncharacterized protein n=1 Tax=Colwellia chukchiensis TaxID=641665 RepID=A0A1H7U8K2_9GAMM|nr:hypothetical protein SAMN05216262_1357 [Colwellia chukchiensis]